jgi:hypothetical protein
MGKAQTQIEASISRLQGAQAFGHDLFANAVTGDDGNLLCWLHMFLCFNGV